MTNSSTRIPRCEVVGLREAIFAENPDLPVFGARALGLFLLCAPDPDVPEAQPAPGAARRGSHSTASRVLTAYTPLIAAALDSSVPTAQGLGPTAQLIIDDTLLERWP